MRPACAGRIRETGFGRDFSARDRISGSYVTPELRSRESDIVWRVRWGQDRWLYVYLLIEFQSTVDPFMALRVQVYVGLLYQDLVQHRQLTTAGKLPPVLPLVLYNGTAPWGAVRELAELIEEVPGGLEQYRPRLRYCLLDEAQIADSELESLRNLAAALFRLEKSRGPEDIQRILTALIEWLQEPGLAELRRSFAAEGKTARAYAYRFVIRAQKSAYSSRHCGGLVWCGWMPRCSGVKQ